ncbi:hypothetical protein GF407_13895 [candidate division KSB1 bacterium]|nr:hypothetical protein [candidate division KSB1 bacterium]
MTFITTDIEKWQVKGNRPVTLTFESVMVDNARDRFGIITLALDTAMVIVCINLNSNYSTISII